MDQSGHRIGEKCDSGEGNRGFFRRVMITEESGVRNKRGKKGGERRVGQSDGRKIQWGELTGDSLGVCALHCFFCMRTRERD